MMIANRNGRTLTLTKLVILRCAARPARRLEGRTLLPIAGLLLTTAAYAADSAPDLQSNGGTAWIAMNNDLAPVPGEVPPTTWDPAHPYVANGRTAQPTFRIADTNNPNLKPWAAAQMKKNNEDVLNGKLAFTAR